MLSQFPIDLDKLSKEDIDKELLRIGIIAELDAISLYEQLAAKTKNPLIKKVFLTVAKEEKTHVGEFESILFEKDSEQFKEYEKGKKEIAEIKKNLNK